MSAIELPHVSSSRSSSRGSLHSAGSNTSEKSGKNFNRNQRSHASVPARGYDGNDSEDADGGEEESDDNEGYEDDGQEEEEEEEPQESSGGLWDEVESFLNRPSPTLSALAKPDKKSGPGSVLPTLKSEQRRKDSEPESHSTRAGRPARSLHPATASKASSASKVIDPKLLQEAFAYAHKVSVMDVEEDQQTADVINDRHHPLGRSGSRNSSSSSLLSGKESGGPSASRPSNHRGSTLKKQSSTKGDDAKKKKSSTKSSVYGSGVKPPAATKRKSERRIKEAMQWDTSNASGAVEAGGEGGGGASRKNMDPQVMQSLVSNFQNGTTLDELRKELAASQQSMALSRQVLHEAAQSFFKPRR